MTVAIHDVTPRSDWPPKYVPREDGNGIRMNPAFIALWEPYLAEGMPGSAVAEIFGVNKHSVYKYCRGRGWSHQQVSEMGAYISRYGRKLRSAGRK